MTFIVNQGYKSDMYSCLTKAPNSTYPQTLEDLSKTDFQVITYDGMANLGGSMSSLKFYIEETVSSAIFQGASYPRYFEQLDKKLVWYPNWLDG